MEDKSDPKSPHLVFYYGQENVKKQIFYNLKDKTFETKSIKQMEYTKCIPTWTGWLLVIHPRGQCYFLDPLSMSKVNMPRFMWKIKGHVLCTLSSSPNNPNCIVLCGDSKKKFLLLCNPSDKKWFKYDYGDENMSLTDMVSSNGVFYGLASDFDYKIVAITGYDSKNVKIEVLDVMNMKWPSGLGSCITYLVEYYGKIFVLERFYLTENSNTTYRVCIKKKDEVSLEWEDVDDIGDMVIFLGSSEAAFSSCASNVGVKKNCVYFVEFEDPRMYCYDLEEGVISSQILAPSLNRDGLTPIWIMPLLF